MPVRLPPSYGNGFARSPGESAAPEQWYGLVGDWEPCLGATGGTLYDQSGYANHGILTSMVLATDWVMTAEGMALNFDGADNYVNVGHSASLGDIPAFSAIVRIYPRTLGELNASRMFSKRPTNGGWHFVIAGSNRLQFLYDHNTTDLLRESATNTLVMDTWQTVGFTFTRGTAAANCLMYKNGVEVPSYATTTNGSGTVAADLATDLTIGNNTAGTVAVDGHILLARLYNRILTDEEMFTFSTDLTALHRLRPRKIAVQTSGGLINLMAGKLALVGKL